ncbi:MAG: HTTM domain-containing protein [Planctomycetota bacterium]|nr:HTTM domain-containing protein [Planctomycetota bacterium]MDA1177922.1 HTTM domain-containing protein [Planctomycetota bacterium]
MNLIVGYLRELRAASVDGWNRFWFTAQDPATLCVIRVLAGSMLFYTHLVWGVNLSEMWGPQGKLAFDFSRAFQGGSWSGWSHVYAFEHNALALTSVHVIGLFVLAAFTLGMWTRVTSVLAWLLSISYSHRGVGALYGLDQINAMLSLYLMIGPSGAMYSFDARWRGTTRTTCAPSIGANISIRMIQIHMCLIYLFAALGKLLGSSWWDGSALWGAFANYEYQTIDMTWMAQHQILVNLMTHLTLFWELSYIVFIWHRLTRPIVLALAIPLHLGIALAMGMTTFGLVMLYGNFAFISPGIVRKIVAQLARPAWAGQGRGGASLQRPN